MAEDKLRTQRRELLVAADVAAELGKQLGAVRDGLLSMPARMAPVIHAAKTIGEVQALLDTELRHTLGQLVGYAGLH